MEAGFLRKGGVLLLWWSVVVVQGGFSSYKTCDLSDWYQVSIPKSGIYMVTVTVDQKYLESEHLSLAGFNHITAFGDYVLSGLTVALPMNAGLQSVVDWSSSRRGNFRGATGVSVVYISDLLEGYFVMVRLKISNSDPTYYYSAETTSAQSVIFNSVMDDSGKWNSQLHSNFKVEQSGIHWVSARPDPSFGTAVNVEILNDNRVLFTVYADGGQAISTSGAYYLERHSDVTMKVQKFKRLYSATLLSFAFLAQYKSKIKTSDYIAWTAYVDQTSTQTYRKGETVMFKGKGALTDYGSLYNANTGHIVITVSGSYLISIRMDPCCQSHPSCSLKGVLYLNGNLKWSVWAEGGTPSGHAVALPLSSGDKLHLEAELDRDVDAGTMMSIAFVAP